VKVVRGMETVSFARRAGEQRVRDGAWGPDDSDYSTEALDMATDGALLEVLFIGCSVAWDMNRITANWRAHDLRIKRGRNVRPISLVAYDLHGSGSRRTVPHWAVRDPNDETKCIRVDTWREGAWIQQTHYVEARYSPEAERWVVFR